MKKILNQETKVKIPESSPGDSPLFQMALSGTHFGNQSDIDVFVAATGQWETLATVHSVVGIDAEDLAAFILASIQQRSGA